MFISLMYIINLKVDVEHTNAALNLWHTLSVSGCYTCTYITFFLAFYLNHALLDNKFLLWVIKLDLRNAADANKYRFVRYKFYIMWTKVTMACFHLYNISKQRSLCSNLHIHILYLLALSCMIISIRKIRSN